MKAVFHRKTFIWSLGLCLLLIVNIGMSIMFLSIMFGMPIFVSMAALIGGILLGIGLLAGEATYTVDAFGLRQEIGPLNWFKLIDKKIDRHFSWKDIEWAQMGTDLNRSLVEYHYLKIKLTKWPYHLQLTSDKADLNEYNQFISVFNQLSGNSNKIEETNNEQINTPAQFSDVPPSSIPYNAPNQKIKIKPDFYSTKKAKLLFIVFCIFILGIVSFIIDTGTIKITHALRFGLIIIPGMWYFYWRLFVRK